ncbi:RHS repeat domain-containing protein, partial [Maricaulis sp. D1M11]|uniref:RHS repeat domain-containing protein n=1 Tax=Maricaulis sp. D1M11 TaxID=3076117 RepID=UPI0039B544BC
DMNRVVGTVRSGRRISSTHLTALDNPNHGLTMDDIRPSSHLYDRWEWSVFDARGQLISTILGDGSVTRYAYDDLGRLVATLGFVNRLDSSVLDGFKTTPPTTLTLPGAHADDVITRNFYDGDGLLIGTMDGSGYLTQFVFDGNGRKVSETLFDQATQPSLRLNGTFDELLASITPNAAKDVTNHYVYDGQGFLRFTIDALGRITENV